MKRTAILVLTFILAFGVLSVYSGADSETSEVVPGEEVRIISINLSVEERDKEERCPEMLKMLLSFRPDTIGTQENGGPWPAFFEDNLETIGYARVGLSPEGLLRGGKLAGDYIYYDSEKYECLKWDTFWVTTKSRMIGQSYRPTFPRMCTWAILENKKTGFRFAHVNCHLAFETEEENLYHMQMVSRMLIQFDQAGIPAFSTGDYNTSEGSRSYQLMMSTPGIGDPKYLAETTSNKGTWRGWEIRDTTGSRAIDFCFSTAEKMDFRQYYVIETFVGDFALSDHNGLFVDAEVHSLPEQYSLGASVVPTEGMAFKELSRRAYVYDFEITQPVDVKYVYDYYVELRDSEGKLVDTREIPSYNVDEVVLPSVTCTFGALEPDSEYTVIVYARNVLGARAEGVPFSFRTTPLE